MTREQNNNSPTDFESRFDAEFADRFSLPLIGESNDKLLTDWFKAFFKQELLALAEEVERMSEKSKKLAKQNDVIGKLSANSALAVYEQIATLIRNKVK